MWVADNRIGGQPIRIWTRNPGNLMQVPEEIRKSVVFLAQKPATEPRMANWTTATAGAGFRRAG
jgi:hypothetical protein